MSRLLSRRHLAAVRRSAPVAFASRWVHTPAFATVSPQDISGSSPAEVQSFVQGRWTPSANWSWIVDPLNGDKFIKVAEIQGVEITPFVESLSNCQSMDFTTHLELQRDGLVTISAHTRRS